MTHNYLKLNYFSNKLHAVFEGLRMGKMVTKIGIIMLLQQYHFECMKKGELEFDNHSVTLVLKGGIDLKVSKRKWGYYKLCISKKHLLSPGNNGVSFDGICNAKDFCHHIKNTVSMGYFSKFKKILFIKKLWNGISEINSTDLSFISFLISWEKKSF